MPLIAILAAICASFLNSGCASDGPASDADSLLARFEGRAGSITSAYSSDADLSYLATFPAGYTDSEARGLIVFLHSLEERGESLELVYDNPAGEGPGLAKIALEHPDFPFVTLSPLCPAGSYWTFLHGRLEILIREFIAAEHIDPNRVVLSGVSMGGMGTWSMAMAQPELFAAIAPISGAVYSPPIRPRYRRIAGIPAMVFHDVDDPSIPYEKAQKTVERFRQAGGTAAFESYITGRHYIHAEAYRSELFVQWLLEVGVD
jgi:predicted peptidase